MPPEKLGRYEIVRELGHGAMGVVYEAVDPTIGRRVALKAIRFDGIGTTADEAAKRFKNEARAAGGLNHPNLVTVYDAGEDGGNLYLAMEFIEGSNLDELLRTRRTLPPEKAIEIVRQVGAGLDFAHSKGIIHRDIKPANIMLGPHGLVKITDFGIARAGEAMTLTGQVVGTPHYMSPEQIVGKTLDGRSDLFSVGVMLYEMITGERPFDAQTITTIMYKIVHEEPIPPRKLDSTIHPGLSAIVEKALAKAPEGRFQTGAALTQALENYTTAPMVTRSLDLPTQEFPIPDVSRKPDAGSITPPPPAPPSAFQQQQGAVRAFFAGLSPRARRRIRILLVIGALFLVSRYWSRDAKHIRVTSDDDTPSTTTVTPPPAPTVKPSEPPAQEAQKPDNASVPTVTKHEDSSANKQSAVLKVSSSPPAAEIEVDGKPTGKSTPAEVQLSRGQHSVSVRMAGFMPAKATFHVKGGEEMEYSPQLSVAMPNISIPGVDMPDFTKLQELTRQNKLQGKEWQQWALRRAGALPHLAINSSPLGARILIDGKDTGQTSPALIPLEPGNHHVRLELDDFEPAEHDFVIDAHKSAAWNPTLQPSHPQQ